MERTLGPFVQVCRSVRACVGNGSVSGFSADLVPVEAHVEPVWCIEFPACQGHLGTFRNSKALATPRKIKTVSGHQKFSYFWKDPSGKMSLRNPLCHCSLC